MRKILITVILVRSILILLTLNTMQAVDLMCASLVCALAQSFNTFYTLDKCKIKCLNSQFNEKEKFNPIPMLE